MQLFNIDLSYKHATRYIIDIHFALILSIGITYLIEDISNEGARSLIFIWGWAIMITTLYRAFTFFETKTDVETSFKNSVDITEEMCQKIRCEVDKTDTSITNIVDAALVAYFNKREKNKNAEINI